MSLLLDQLTRRKRRLVIQRFGLDGRGGATLDELAEAENISLSRMGQILKAALRKLAHGTGFDEVGHLRWGLVGRRPKRDHGSSVTGPETSLLKGAPAAE